MKMSFKSNTMKAQLENKLTLINFMRERREFLFGRRIPSESDKAARNEAWDACFNLAVSLNIISPDKSSSDLRDHTYAVWKTRVLKKHHLVSEGALTPNGKKIELNDVDIALLGLIGESKNTVIIKEPSIIKIENSSDTSDLSYSSSQNHFFIEETTDGINSSDTSYLNTNYSQNFSESEEIPILISEENPSSSTTNNIQIKTTAAMKRKKLNEPDEMSELDDVSSERKRLLILKAYKTQLECLKLERELGLPLSSFTKSLKNS